MSESVKRRYIVISGNGLPPLTCAPSSVHEMIGEFIGEDSERMEPVTLTDSYLTDDAYEALGDWEP